MPRVFSIPQTKEFLDRIRGQLYRFSYDELKIAVYEQVPLVPVIISPFDRIHPFKEGGFYKDRSILYKARQNESRFKKGSTMPQPWRNIRDIGIIPDEKLHLIKRGRINRPNQAIFYCSNDFHIACYEAVSKGFPLESNSNNAFLTVGQWRIKETLNLARLYYPEKGLEYFKEYNEKLYAEKLEFRQKDRQNIIDLLRDEQSPIELERSIMLLDFFSDEIGRISIEGDQDYMLCNFYAENVLERTFLEEEKHIDGILYPSVPFSYTGDNVALTKGGMKKLEFMGAMYVWLVYNPSSKDMQHIPIEQNVYADEHGNLNWRLFRE